MNRLDERYDEILDDAFSTKLDEIIGFSNAARVNPEAKNKLKGILKHYAKMKHPFTACVRDNTQRFGPERAKKVCAVVKDIIWGTTKWRGKGNKSGVGPHSVSASEMTLEIDDETAALIERLSELELGELLGLAIEGEDDV